jgi:hypothetical protein
MAALREDIKDAYDEVMGPPPDRVDEAIRTIRAARKFLDDKRLMSAVRERLQESQKAVEASEGISDD